MGLRTFEEAIIEAFNGILGGFKGVQGPFTVKNITVKASTITVKSAAGLLHNVTINASGKDPAGTVAVYNNTAGGTGSPIAMYDPDRPNSFGYDVNMTSGIVVKTTGASAHDITLSYL